MSDAPLSRLIAELAETAALPSGAAMSAPPGIYHRADVLELERARIFRRGWLCAGLAAEVAEPGDYLTFSIDDQPVVGIRGEDGVIRSFSNVCRHRLMILLTGRGRITKAVCPYHAWTYDLQGRLRGAGHMERTDCFDRAASGLPEVRTEIWEGWVYVTLDPDAPSVDSQLAGLREVTGRYGMQDYIPVVHQDEVWQTNWKLLVENFAEGYHGPVAHKATVGAGVRMSDIAFPDTRAEGYSYQTFLKPETAQFGVAHPDNTRLDGDWRRTGVLPTVFPSHMYSLSPDYLWYLSLRPRGTGEVQVRIGIALAPEVHAGIADMDAFLAEFVDFFDRVNAEDREIVEALYRGAQAPLATRGPLSWLERGVHDFAVYLARALSDTAPAARLAAGGRG